MTVDPAGESRLGMHLFGASNGKVTHKINADFDYRISKTTGTLRIFKVKDGVQQKRRLVKFDFSNELFSELKKVATGKASQALDSYIKREQAKKLLGNYNLAGFIDKITVESGGVKKRRYEISTKGQMQILQNERKASDLHKKTTGREQEPVRPQTTTEPAATSNDAAEQDDANPRQIDYSTDPLRVNIKRYEIRAREGSSKILAKFKETLVGKGIDTRMLHKSIEDMHAIEVHNQSKGQRATSRITENIAEGRVFDRKVRDRHFDASATLRMIRGILAGTRPDDLHFTRNDMNKLQDTLALAYTRTHKSVKTSIDQSNNEDRVNREIERLNQVFDYVKAKLG